MEQSKVTIFVGGLSDNLKEEKLEAYFHQYTKKLYARVLRNPKTGRSKGYGFLHLEDKEAATRILQKEHSIDGRKIDCQIAKASKSLIGTDLPQSSNKNRLYVAGLSPEITDNDLFEYFSYYRPVKSAYVIRDYYTQKSKLFAYVVFFSIEDAFSVFKIETHVIKGKKVKLSKFKNEKKGGKRNNKSWRDDGGMRSDHKGGVKKMKNRKKRNKAKHQKSPANEEYYQQKEDTYYQHEQIELPYRRCGDGPKAKRPYNWRNINNFQQSQPILDQDFQAYQKPIHTRSRFKSDDLVDYRYNNSINVAQNQRRRRSNILPERQNFNNFEWNNQAPQKVRIPFKLDDICEPVKKINLIQEFSRQVDHHLNMQNKQRTRITNSSINSLANISYPKRLHNPSSKYSLEHLYQRGEIKSINSLSNHQSNSHQKNNELYQKNFNQNHSNQHSRCKIPFKEGAWNNKVTSLQNFNEQNPGFCSEVLPLSKYRINIPFGYTDLLAEHGISNKDLSLLILEKIPTKFQILKKSLLDFPLNLKKILEWSNLGILSECSEGEYSNDQGCYHIEREGKSRMLLHSLISKSSFNSQSQL